MQSRSKQDLKKKKRRGRDVWERKRERSWGEADGLKPKKKTEKGEIDQLK